MDLTPPHLLLDIGCGSLRGGLHFINYLNEENYYGIDISPDIIEEGKKFLKDHELENKKAILSVNTNLQFNTFEGKKFDFLNAQSVLSHMPYEDIEECFKNLHKVMHDKSIFIATFFEDTTYHPSANYMNFHYPFKMLEKLGEENNLNVKLISDNSYKRKQHLLKITIKN